MVNVMNLFHVISASGVILSIVFLIFSLTKIVNATWPYRGLCALLAVGSITSFLVLPDPRVETISAVALTELNALCALDKERASGEAFVEPTTDQPIAVDSKILQTVRSTCEAKETGTAGE